MNHSSVDHGWSTTQDKIEKKEREKMARFTVMRHKLTFWQVGKTETFIRRNFDFEFIVK